MAGFDLKGNLMKGFGWGLVAVGALLVIALIGWLLSYVGVTLPIVG